ncbi:hypothetical protein F5Y09DRAFT_164142 [Xylaria sp. FL1042]|nr:hypothetical protein F5Y09DRAFT_164142 [Xylaria sp. FL1042]
MGYRMRRAPSSHLYRPLHSFLIFTRRLCGICSWSGVLSPYDSALPCFCCQFHQRMLSRPCMSWEQGMMTRTGDKVTSRQVCNTHLASSYLQSAQRVTSTSPGRSPIQEPYSIEDWRALHNTAQLAMHPPSLTVTSQDPEHDPSTSSSDYTILGQNLPIDLSIPRVDLDCPVSNKRRIKLHNIIAHRYI